MKTNYSWVAEWKYVKGMYLRIDEGDAECGMVEPVTYIDTEPTYFRTKEACRKWTKEWFRGSFKVYKVENK